MNMRSGDPTAQKNIEAGLLTRIGFGLEMSK